MMDSQERLERAMIEGAKGARDEALEERKNENAKRLRIINKSAPIAAIDIWCDKCKKDEKSIGFKEVREYSSEWFGGLTRAVYRAKCKRKHTVYRYITDKHKDPWYRKSKLLRAELMSSDDLLQEGMKGWDKTEWGRETINKRNQEQYEREQREFNQRNKA